MQPAIKWAGSKRSQAEKIVSYFPTAKAYYEPFVGGASVLIRTNYPQRIASDKYEPLILLWKKIQETPEDVIDSYITSWNLLQKEGSKIYYAIRKRYNRNYNPLDLFFLCRTCYSGLIRFNKKGDFNTSFHLSRPGIGPSKIKKIIFNWSSKLKDVKFVCGDYNYTTKHATKSDFVYNDPPYFHTKGMYRYGINFDRFARYLASLNNRDVKWAVSFDGVVEGGKNYLVNIPRELYKRHLLLYSGNSSLRRLMGQNRQVYESLYLNY